MKTIKVFTLLIGFMVLLNSEIIAQYSRISVDTTTDPMTDEISIVLTISDTVSVGDHVEQFTMGLVCTDGKSFYSAIRSTAQLYSNWTNPVNNARRMRGEFRVDTPNKKVQYGFIIKEAEGGTGTFFDTDKASIKPMYSAMQQGDSLILKVPVYGHGWAYPIFRFDHSQLNDGIRQVMTACNVR